MLFLDSMIKALILISATLGFQFAQAKPSVFDQLAPSPFVQESLWEEMGDNNPMSTIEGKVISYEALSSGAKVTLEKGGKQTTIRLRMCKDKTNGLEYFNEDDQITREESAIYIQQRMDVLRAAEQNHRNVRLKFRGPWKPCLVSVSQI